MAAEDIDFKASGKIFLRLSKEHSQRCSFTLVEEIGTLVEKIRVSR
jgi:hypothetical protein